VVAVSLSILPVPDAREVGMVMAPGYLFKRGYVGLGMDGKGMSTLREVGTGEVHSSEVMCDSIFGICITG
jgi:hypothetical protein